MTWRKILAIAVPAVLLGVVAVPTLASNGKGLKAALTGFEEVPAISTAGNGAFKAKVSPDDSSIAYELSYEGLEGEAAQAHIHFGQFSVNGGISVFLCTNLGNGPSGTQGCPESGTVTGTITAADVIGPSGQGISAGELDELLAAIRAGVAYVNVHSDLHPGGEIRGQIR